MTSFAQLNAVCQSLNGYRETRDAQHPLGNVTKIWAELDPPLQGAYWCIAGVCYAWKHAGRPWPAIDRPYGAVYCPDVWTYARHAGLWDTDGHYVPGDTILYDFVGAGYPDHAEILIGDAPSTMRTFGFNTTPDGGVGVQWNGGGAYYKTRQKNRSVMGVVKTSTWLTSGPSPIIPTPRGHRNPYVAPLHTVVPGQRDSAPNGSVHWVQWAVGVPCDGVYGPMTKHAVEMFQGHHLLTIDGIVGADTGRVLRTVTH